MLLCRRLLGGDESNQIESEAVDNSLKAYKSDSNRLEEGDHGGEPVLTNDNIKQCLVHMHKCGERIHHQLCIGVGEWAAGHRVHPCNTFGYLSDDAGETLSDDESLLGGVEDVDLQGGDSEGVGHSRDIANPLQNLVRGGVVGESSRSLKVKAVSGLRSMQGHTKVVELLLCRRLLGGDESNQIESEAVDNSLKAYKSDSNRLEEGDHGGEPVLTNDNIKQCLVHMHKCGERIHHQLCIGVGEWAAGHRVHPCNTFGYLSDDAGETLSDDESLLGGVEDVDLQGGDSEGVGHSRDIANPLQNLVRGGGVGEFCISLKIKAVSRLGVLERHTEVVELLLCLRLLGGDESNQIEGEAVDDRLQAHKSDPNRLEEGDHGGEPVLANDNIEQCLVHMHECGERIHHQLCIGVGEWAARHRVHLLDAVGNLSNDAREPLSDDDSLLRCVVECDLGGGDPEAVGHLGNVLNSLHNPFRHVVALGGSLAQCHRRQEEEEA